MASQWAVDRRSLPFAPPRNYWTLARTHTYSLLFALPLLVAYELLALAMGRLTAAELRNAADVALRGALAALGLRGSAGFFVVIIAAAVLLIVREQRDRRLPLRWAVFAGMAAESTVLALCFGAVVSRLTAIVLPTLTNPAQVERLPLAQQLVLSLGAGLYEELLFRVVLVTAIAWFMARVLRVGDQGATLAAVVASAFLFSAFHYVGPYGDTFELASFAFRFVGGLAFSAIFVLRGFGIVAWTHALYDVFLLTSMALF